MQNDTPSSSGQDGVLITPEMIEAGAEALASAISEIECGYEHAHSRAIAESVLLAAMRATQKNAPVSEEGKLGKPGQPHRGVAEADSDLL